MDIWEMRLRLKECPKYRSLKWSAKVDSMKPNQVIAVYKSFLQNDMFREKKRKKKRDIFGNKFVEFTQPTLFDIFPDVMRGTK